MKRAKNEECEYPKVAVLVLKIRFPELDIDTFTLNPRILPTEGMMFSMEWKEHFDPNGDYEPGQTEAEIVQKYSNQGFYKVHVWGIELTSDPNHGWVDALTIFLCTESYYNKKYGFMPLTQRISIQ